MSKELEALERLYCAGRLDLDYVLNGDQSQDYKLVEKALKALQIIGKKGVNIYFLKETDNAEEYNELIKSHYGMKQLTQEEFDLLKEELL